MFKRFANSLNSKGQTFAELNKKSASSTSIKLPSFEDIQVTPEYLHVKELIEEECKVIFVTGGAGTGKSTFVRWLEREYPGRVAIAAPTGVAALTVSGVTIHRLFKFPPAWVLDKDITMDPKSVIPNIDLLILDEISMVNANVLDSIDKFCRLHRKNKSHLPFGGLALIMVGDLFQLPPVSDKETKPLFERFYISRKFFAANCLQDVTLVGVELKFPFRQTDEILIRLLSKIREGLDLDESVEEFNSVCQITKTPPNGAIYLAPRNRDVERINSEALSNLPDPEYIFEGKLAGKFFGNQLPAPNILRIKVGAQVVLLSNSKLWSNGNVGIIQSVRNQRLTINILKSGLQVDVGLHTWTNYEYVFNKEEDVVERTVVGTYTQYPVSLAWAMTIHKAQGLTLDRVHLDLAGGAFETGQTYVALSRSRTMDTITLARELRPGDVLVDKEAVDFYDNIRR